jgi:CRP/FNR family transcriptional regulator, cyclic AMP receptor protein
MIMVSPEIIRRYPFFSGLTMEQVITLAKLAEELSVPGGHYFHLEGDDLKNFYLILEGEVNVITKLPQKDKEVVISTLGAGDVFGWSSMVPPHSATAGAKSAIPSRVLAFDCQALFDVFESDCKFGYVMMLKIAQLIRERLNDLRLETIAYVAG